MADKTKADKKPTKADKKAAKVDISKDIAISARADAEPAKTDKLGRPKKPNRIESNSETVREIVRLASRPEGATKHELETASGWKNAGWPWMFFNPKTGKGIAPRHGKKLKIKERAPEVEGGRALKAYCLV